LRYPLIRGVECRVLPYTMKFAKAQSKSSEISENELASYVFVKGFLKENWMHSNLYRSFEAHGTILSAKVSIDKHHKGKGFGYIQFATREMAERAISIVSLV
jgi:RNA recognition motif-containing protein